MVQRDDEGMTLIELLIAMSVTLLLMATLSSAFALGLKTARGSEQDAGNSADTQLLATFFEWDVASAETVSTSSTCGTGGTVLLALKWKDGGVAHEVAYRSVANADRQGQLNLTTPVYDLLRAECASTSDVQTIARTLSAVPEVRCDGEACSSPTPRQITLTATAYSTQLSDPGKSVYTFGLTAARRVRP